MPDRAGDVSVVQGTTAAALAGHHEGVPDVTPWPGGARRGAGLLTVLEAAVLPGGPAWAYGAFSAPSPASATPVRG
jgi:hypothetical protein